MRKTVLILLVLILLNGCHLFKSIAGTGPHLPELIEVEGGTFLMGDLFGDGNSDAQPVHSITLDPFRIGKYEVTYGEYDAFARAAYHFSSSFAIV